MPWPSLRTWSWSQSRALHSDRTQQRAQIPKVYDRSGEEPVAKYEHDAIELQAVCQQHSSTSTPHPGIPPRQSTIHEGTVVVLGAGGVGKDTLFSRFVFDGSNGYDPFVKSYLRHVTVDDQTSVLEFLSTAGTEQFTALTEFYIKVSHGFFLVFSLTQGDSLREVQNLREQIYRVKGTTHVPIVIVGTNSDLTEERQVSREALMQLSAMWEMPIYEVSVRKYWHVQDVLDDLVRQLRVRKSVPRRSGHHRRRRPR